MPNKSRKRIYRGGSSKSKSASASQSQSVRNSTTKSTSRSIRGMLSSFAHSASTAFKGKRVTNKSCSDQINALDLNFRMINRAYSRIKHTRHLSKEQIDEINDTVFDAVLRLKCLVLRFILLRLAGDNRDSLSEYMSIIETLKSKLHKADVDVDLKLIKDCMVFYDTINISNRTSRQSEKVDDVSGKRHFVRVIKGLFNLSDDDLITLTTGSFRDYLGCKTKGITSFKIHNQTYKKSIDLPSVPTTVPVLREPSAGKKGSVKPRRKSRKQRRKMAKN